jgi:hypothetical protein
VISLTIFNAVRAAAAEPVRAAIAIVGGGLDPSQALIAHGKVREQTARRGDRT